MPIRLVGEVQRPGALLGFESFVGPCRGVGRGSDDMGPLFWERNAPEGAAIMHDRIVSLTELTNKNICWKERGKTSKFPSVRSCKKHNSFKRTLLCVRTSPTRPLSPHRTTDVSTRKSDCSILAHGGATIRQKIKKYLGNRISPKLYDQLCQTLLCIITRITLLQKEAGKRISMLSGCRGHRALQAFMDGKVSGRACLNPIRKKRR